MNTGKHSSETETTADDILNQLADRKRELFGALAHIGACGDSVPADELQALTSALSELNKSSALLGQAVSEKADSGTIAHLRSRAIAADMGASRVIAQAHMTAGGLLAQKAGSLSQAEALKADAGRLADRSQRALFDDKIFDPSLRFTSTAEEEAYRKREVDRLALLNGLDPHDPRHDRNRLLVQQSQLEDAMAHGAEDDPRASQMRDEIAEMLRRQREQAIATGADPQAFDAADEALRQRLPTGGKRYEEKAAYLARGSRGDAEMIGAEAGVAQRTTTKENATPTAIQAAAHKAMDEIPDALDAAPASSSLQKVVDQLKAAGVSAASDAIAPTKPGFVVGQAVGTGRLAGLT